MRFNQGIKINLQGKEVVNKDVSAKASHVVQHCDSPNPNRLSLLVHLWFCCEIFQAEVPKMLICYCIPHTGSHVIYYCITLRLIRMCHHRHYNCIHHHITWDLHASIYIKINNTLTTKTSIISIFYRYDIFHFFFQFELLVYKNLLNSN